MTGQEWINCQVPEIMIAALNDCTFPNRKYWLFQLTCMERVKPLLPIHHWSVLTWSGLIVRGRVFADTSVKPQKFSDLCEEIINYGDRLNCESAIFSGLSPGEFYSTLVFHRFCKTLDNPRDLVEFTSHAQIAMGCLARNQMKDIERTPRSEIDAVRNAAERNEAAVQCDLFREIFGNPFHPNCVDPSWCIPVVVTLAQSMYIDRQFEAMPILGDALEEAGCTNEDILHHCRDKQDHVRGCWVVDLLLGKK